ncbi:type II secretion system protein [Chitinimonas sp. PSY-7]|uniref:type II secretion system protein n=1 Tax=Chitinimonas sp. PSY-7 TaxID=3459088 RepID=UPI0040401C7F
MNPLLPRQAGFSYLALLIFLAVMGVAASATVLLGSIAQRRQAEDTLLQTGAAYRAALSSYYRAMPPGKRRYPQRLEDLLLDSRFPKLKRHLRQLYPDPITGQMDWQLIRHPDGGIMAIASKSTASPIKVDLFAPNDSDFKGKSHYADWVFTAQTQANDNDPGL